MATDFKYASQSDLNRYCGEIVANADSKRQIYDWASGISNFDSGTSVDIFYTHNTGFIDSLFWDGAKILKTTFRGGSSTTQGILNGAMTDSTTEFYLDGGHSIESKDIIKIDSEYIRVTDATGNTMTTTTANRGLFDTSAVAHSNDSSVYMIIDEDGDIGNATSAGQDALGFVYDDDLDMCLLIVNASDPNDYLVESGEDFTTMVTQFRTDASRYLDSRLDPKLPKNQLKDKDGNYDYMIVRTASLYAAAFMVKTKDPTSELAAAIMLEADNNVQLLNEGRAALSWQNTGDASKGVLRDVTYTGAIRPVDFRGRAGGVDYDLVKLEIEDAGAIGTATYNVWVKDSDGLKQNKVVDDQKITGDYQTLAYGLEIRFAGTTDASAAVATDEWEVEVRGMYEEVDTSDLKGIKMTRTGRI